MQHVTSSHSGVTVGQQNSWQTFRQLFNASICITWMNLCMLEALQVIT